VPNQTKFRTQIGETIFQQKYAHEGCETWDLLAEVLVEDVCRDMLRADDKAELVRLIREFKFIPGGRYLRNAGRDLKFFSNCFALRAEEDTREDWADLAHKVESCLISGGGIGVDYSVYRARGSYLRRTGGTASGPIEKMKSVNEQGRSVMQGGSRRSAIYASLDWNHGDANEFLHAKDWHQMPVPGTNVTLADVKQADFNWPAPLDHTNVSLNYNDAWLSLPERHRDPIFLTNVRQALSTAEPGFSFNFGEQSRHTLRNACTEFVTDDDSDVCNLGSVNMANIDSITEFAAACNLGAQFLYCGTVTGLVPNEKSRATRDRNRRIGLGIMGVHEWLTKRGARYEVTPEMHQWLQAYAVEAKAGADTVADRGGLPRSKATRAIAPTGTIGMIAGTTTGIEPVFAVAYKRRYLKNGTDWHYQYVIDAAAKDLIERYSVNPDTIESAVDLAADFERRVKFQADVQDYVDMAISSTINLPAWGTDLNNEDRVVEYGEIISRYAPRLRGLTCYPDGSRGGQPLTSVPYAEAKMWEGVELKEHDSCKGGVCGV
jgi:ribonucleoside-diphosphate reductase alpha chain